MGETDNDTNELQQLLLRHFAPGVPGDARAKNMTTGDLFALVDQHAPGCFSPTMLYQVLSKGGFVDRLVGDEILWSVLPVKRS